MSTDEAKINSAREVNTILMRMRHRIESPNDSQLASFLGTSPKNVSNWRARGSVPREYLLWFSQETGVSVPWLTGAEGKLESYDDVPLASDNQSYHSDRAGITNHRVEQERLANPMHAKDDAFVSIPRIDLKASMGTGCEVLMENQVGSLQFKRAWLQSRNIKLECARLIDGEGDSMEPVLFDGDTILVDTTNADGFGDGIYCIRLDGRLMMKRIQRILGGVKIISENAEKYEPITLQLNDELSQREFAVIGRMRWFAREV